MTKQHPKSEGERGYMLLAIMLLVNLMVIGLMLEAPRIAQEIKREKEEELIHRANEYKVAIRKYFRKFGQYPVSIEQLENTNNMRFLRKRYKDPFTGKDDWRLLHPGDVQVNALNGATGAPGQPMGSAIGQPMGSSFGQTAGNTFGQQPGNSFGQQPGGAFGQQPGSTFGQQPGAFGQQPGGAFGQQPGSTFGQPSGLNGNPSTPAGAQPGSDQSASGAAPGATTG
jgi:type II secretory pathway pseudopilin PulG